MCISLSIDKKIDKSCLIIILFCVFSREMKIKNA